jgi:hypothetical protein
MVCNDFNPERVGKALRTGLDACAGCHVDITLKDVQTVHGDPMRLKNWALLAKEIAGKF